MQNFAFKVKRALAMSKVVEFKRPYSIGYSKINFVVLFQVNSSISVL
jgi:hypothetical protein